MLPVICLGFQIEIYQTVLVTNSGSYQMLPVIEYYTLGWVSSTRAPTVLIYRKIDWNH